MASVNVDPALRAPWTAYRTWAATARFHKSELDFWRRWSLLLAIAGAVLATLGQQIAHLAPKEGWEKWAYQAPGLLGSAAIALAAFFTREAIGGDRERNWIRARSAAESLKSAIYLYRAGVPPFDGPTGATQLLQRVRDVEGTVADVATRALRQESDPDLSSLTVDTYLAHRVEDQIRYYDDRAASCQLKTDHLRTIMLVLGAVSVVLGLLSTTSPVAGWVAVTATVTAALSAYIQNQRYQALLVLYQATARRLRALQSEWAASRKTEADGLERNTFIQNCEATIASESGAWVAQWSAKKPEQNSADPQPNTRISGAAQPKTDITGPSTAGSSGFPHS